MGEENAFQKDNSLFTDEEEKEVRKLPSLTNSSQ